MDELFEAWTWTQLGLQHKPSGLLNHQGYYDPLIEFVDRAVQQGFLTQRTRAALFVDTDMTRLLTRMQDL
jgi:predicted Rossmann-fold nucleotide-binding protein